MKKIIAVIIACAALLTVGFAVGKNYGGQVDKYAAESYEEEAADEKLTVRYEEESVSEQEDRGTETLFENSSEEDEKIKKLAENRPVYNCIEPDGKGAVLYKGSEGRSWTQYDFYYTEDGGKTWELNEELSLFDVDHDFVFINGKLIIFSFNSWETFLNSVSIRDPETGEVTEYSGEELINRTGFSEYGVTELRLIPEVLYKNTAGTFTVGWTYRYLSVGRSPEKSDYLFIAEYSSELELVNTVFLDEELISAYKLIQETYPYNIDDLLFVSDRKLTEDDVNDIMKLDCLGINIASVVLDAKKEYEEKKDKTETDLYNYKFLSGWKTDGRSLYFSAPE